MQAPQTVVTESAVPTPAVVTATAWPIAKTVAVPQPRIDEVVDHAIARAELPVESAFVAFMRRAAEIAIGCLGLVVTSPIMLVVAWIVKRDTPGPAIFGHARVGKDGRLFTFYKFRTLYVDAKERFPDLYAYRYSSDEIMTLQFKRDVDPRVTPAGRWLRRSTLDELPNLWNLVKGDIALVGPRPEIPEMLQHYRPDELVKFSVKPGLTGMAQTHGRNKLRFRETNAYDVDYVRRRSVLLDIRLVLRTVWVLLLSSDSGAL